MGAHTVDEGGRYNNGGVVVTPEGRAAFAAYAAAIATAFPHSKYNVKWELCNEPSECYVNVLGKLFG